MSKAIPEPTHRVTSYDVAQAAGVAQSTVSRCFQPDSEIAAATRARVQAVAAELGYVPNALARSLITRRSNLVAAIVTDFALSANPAVVAGIGRALAESGKELLLFTVTAGSEAATRKAAETALGYPLDGLLVAEVLAAEQVRPFLQRGVPVVFFNRPAPLPEVDRVGTDQAGGARRLAERLVAAGHRRFVCLSGPPDWSVNRERVDGFLAGLAASGAKPAKLLVSGPDYNDGHAAFLAYAAASGTPDAVFCATDALALGVMDACRFDLGLRVPDAISVVGFDDVAQGGHRGYELTTVRQDLDRLAREAIRILADRLVEPGAPPRRVLLPGILIERRSARI